MLEVMDLTSQLRDPLQMLELAQVLQVQLPLVQSMLLLTVLTLSKRVILMLDLMLTQVPVLIDYILVMFSTVRVSE